MSVAITTTGIHRLVLRSSDLARSRRFYIEMLGFPLALEGPNIFLFLVGDTAIEVRGPQSLMAVQEVFNPFRAGLDRIALACADDQEPARVAAAMSARGSPTRASGRTRRSIASTWRSRIPIGSGGS